MKTFIVVVTLVATINARPDVSHLPTGSYLPSGGHVGSGSGQFGVGIGAVGSGGYQTGSFGVGGGDYQGGSGSFQSGGSFHGGSGGSFHGGSGGSFHGGSDGGFIGGTGGFQDQKHVYFYAAPEEQSLSRLRINIVPNSQRNSKIIFIKAPAYGSVVPEVNAPQSLSEDKTLVYVLVKRPEHGGQINIPAGVGVKPSKPEVYFIKYKTQQDAQQQIAGGLQGQQVGSNVQDLGNESNFIRTLDSGSSSSGSIGIGGISGGTSGISGITSLTGSGSHGSNVFTSGSTGSSSNFGPAGASGPY